jgi:hypothetical protein
MARKAVVQVVCERCGREELQPVSDKAKTDTDFVASYKGQSLKYEDLCGYCKETLDNLWKDLAQWKRTQPQPILLKDQAAPLSPAQDNSPPKPHSAEAGKR